MSLLLQIKNLRASHSVRRRTECRALRGSAIRLGRLRLRSGVCFAPLHALTLCCLLFASCTKAQKTDSTLSKPAVSAEISQPAVVPASPESSSTKPDIDLTKMSATMIYSYIFEMLVNPEEYKDKVIKVKGYFNSFQDEQTGKRFFTVIIPDATACCVQGMEFIWPGNHNFPEDYPQQNQTITVTGRYNMTLLDGDISYSYLELSALEF